MEKNGMAAQGRSDLVLYKYTQLLAEDKFDSWSFMLN